MGNPRYIRVLVPLRRDSISIYASPRIADALKEVAMNMDLYRGVRLAQVLEAVYEQGKKDGARAAFESIEGGISEAKKVVPHRNPGRPARK